jgi:hypothetical protein
LESFVSEFDLTRSKLDPLGFRAFSHAHDQGKIPREANDATNPANPATRSSSSNAPKRENIGRPQTATAQREAFENDEDTTRKEGKLRPVKTHPRRQSLSSQEDYDRYRWRTASSKEVATFI